MSDFSVETKKNALIISSSKGLTNGDHENVLKSLETKKEEDGFNDIEMVIFDINGTECESATLRLLAKTCRLLRGSDKEVFVIQTDPEVSRFLNEQGLNITVRQSLSPVLDSTQAKKSEKKNSTNVEFITPFIQGTGKVLSVQCETDVTPGDPTVEMDKSKLPIDIAAVIGLNSNVFNGSIALCFPKDTFLKIMGRMLAEEFDEIDKELEDGAGELLNMIFGQAKIDLNEKGYGIDKAIPTVVRGEKINVKHMVPRAATILPFESSAGPFYIEIAIK